MKSRKFTMDLVMPIEAYGVVSGFADLQLEIETAWMEHGVYEWEIVDAMIGPRQQDLSSPTGEHYDSLIRRVELEFRDEIDAEISSIWSDIDGP